MTFGDLLGLFGEGITMGVKLRVLAAIGGLLGATPSMATSGAEFLQSDPLFAFGYLAGALDMRVGIKHVDDEQFSKIRKCVMGANLTQQTLYEVVVNDIRNNPNKLTQPAFVSLFDVLAEMCVKP